MTNTDNSEIARQVKDLATAVSTQAQVSNRIWLGLMTVAVISLLPQTLAANGVTVPFFLVRVSATWFHLVLFALLIVFTVAFASAHAQQVRAQVLAYRFIDKVPANLELAGMHPRELFDIFRMPSVNRVAPLAQSIRGKYQFYSGKEGCPPALRVATAVYYILLKLVSMVVYFGVPAFALIRTYEEIPGFSFGWWLLSRGCFFIASITLLQIVVSDALYAIKVGKVISSK